MEYYLTLKRKEILTYDARWINSEETMPGEINQSQKDKYCVIPFIWVSQSSQIHRDRKWKGGCPAGEEKE